jgi:hypothetical protein
METKTKDIHGAKIPLIILLSTIILFTATLLIRAMI